MQIVEAVQTTVLAEFKKRFISKLVTPVEEGLFHLGEHPASVVPKSVLRQPRALLTTERNTPLRGSPTRRSG